LQQPLPAPVRASGADELARLPANTVNLEARLDSGAELAGLRRFRDLRRLRILAPVAIPPGPPHAIDWPKLTERRKAARERFADPSAFAVLGDLSMLEDLEVMDGLPLTPEHLAFLRFLKLRSLWICEVDLRSPAMIDALQMAPDLRSLRLSSAAVSADLLRALRALRLERLHLLALRGFRDAAGPALAEPRALCSL